jgi:hypothetical protein
MITAASLLLAGFNSLMVWQQSMPHTQEALAPTPVQQETIASLKLTNEPEEVLLPFSYLALREESLTQKHPVLHIFSGDIKPMPILSAGSYVLPEWQR